MTDLRAAADMAANDIADLFRSGFCNQQMVIDFRNVISKRIESALAQPDEIKSAVLAEREACAKLCDDFDDDSIDNFAGWQYAEAIRGRTE